MVDKYNSTYHRSIKLPPSDARNPSNYQHVYNALYGNVRKSILPKFHVDGRKYNDTYHRSIKLTPSDARNPANTYTMYSMHSVHSKLDHLNSMLVIKYV